MENAVVTKRVTVTAEPGSFISVSRAQYLAAQGYLREVESGDGGRKFDFSPDTYRAMLGKLTTAELMKAAGEAGMPVDETAKKAEVIDTLIKKMAGGTP